MGRKKKTTSAAATRKASKRQASKRQANARAKRQASAKKKKAAAVTPLAVLNADRLKELYATMLKCRMLAERLAGAESSNRRQGHFTAGLEATLVGAGAHLQPQDCIAMEHSGSIASLIKGTPLGLILARTREAQGGNGAQLPTALAPEHGAMKRTMTTGLRLAQEMKGKGAVTLIFCSQDPGARNSGAPLFDAEAMSLAATQKLPMVCLAVRNVHARSESPAPGPAAGDDPAYYPRIAVDGCDVVAVFRVAQEAIRRAREGHGPAVIECMTARPNGQSTEADNHEWARSIASDPLLFMELYLRRRNLWSDEWSTAAAFARELDTSFRSHPAANDDGFFDNVYSADSWRPPREAGAGSQAAAIPPAP